MFVSRIQNVVFDEAHCIVQWDTFREGYDLAPRIRWLLRNIPIYLSSATLPPGMIKTLEHKFDWKKTDYILFKWSNDRHNIGFIVRSMKHSQASFEDLAFLVPKDWQDGDPVPKKFMVFFDSKKDAEAAAKYLRSRVSLEMQKKLPWFHAGMTRFFRAEEVEGLKSGEVWGFAATDSGGMVMLCKQDGTLRRTDITSGS